MCPFACRAFVPFRAALLRLIDTLPLESVPESDNLLDLATIVAMDSRRTAITLTKRRRPTRCRANDDSFASGATMSRAPRVHLDSTSLDLDESYWTRAVDGANCVTAGEP